MTTPKPDLLLHICCAPCCTHPIELLQESYSITGYFYNPNLFPPSEHQLRLQETESYLKSKNIPVICENRSRSDWLNDVKLWGSEKEGGHRCGICFHHRLEKTAQTASENGFDYFTTSLTIGPNKPARVIFPIAEAIAEKWKLHFVALDFKKKDGYKHSCLLSREAGMYRQDYCGCEYSLRDRNIRKANRNS